MSIDGVLIRPRTLLVCTVALLTGISVGFAHAADDTSPTAEVWSKEVPAPPPPSSPESSASPAETVALPSHVALSSSAKGELHATRIDSAASTSTNLADSTTAQAPPATTSEIPAMANQPQSDPADASAQPGQSDQDDPLNGYNPELARYAREQMGMSYPGASMISDQMVLAPIGIELSEDRHRVASGEEADGLVVMKVFKGSPADEVGLHAMHASTKKKLMMGAALVSFPILGPISVLAMGGIEGTGYGEDYDMIIGVDGYRVSNFLELQDRLHYVQPGQILYLSILRDGKREQFRIPIPPSNNASW
jgi:hypothetical protein